MSLFHTKHLLCTILRGFGYIVRTLVLGLLHSYRYTFGLLLPGSCRFSPTCSAYAIEAIRVHGTLKGMVMTGCRLAKCHPWSRCSGYHPVAEKCPSPNAKKILELDKKANQPAM